MLTASQDIDYFIERQRSKLNKPQNQKPNPRQRPVPLRLPPPPPPAPSSQSRYSSPNSLEDRLDFKVARILDERPPPVNTFPEQPLSSPVPYYPEQESLSYSNDMPANNQMTFFDRFGAHDEKRARLKEDLKREYNDFLHTQRTPRGRAASQAAPQQGNTTRRVQFKENGKVVAPWEKGSKSSMRNSQSMNDVSSSYSATTTTTTSRDYGNNQMGSVVARTDEQYIRDREEYILELYDQIRELEARKRQLEIESSRLSGSNSSNVTRAHYAEDLTALNTLLAERLNQRNAIDHELARILNRPPVTTSPTMMGNNNLPVMSMSFDSAMQNNQSTMNDDRQRQTNRINDRRQKRNPNDGFQIGQEADKEAEQAAKKRYQQELQAQMREAQMRKVQAKQEKDEYDKKLESDIKRYNYFGRSGGGAPMRDKDGNVIANLADLRNPPQDSYPSSRNPQQQQQQSYGGFDDKAYSLGGGTTFITNPISYGGDSSSYPPNTDRSQSPNHARGAVSNGIFGTVKTEEQLMREERYKSDLKKQIDEKRQRNAEELARRRAEEERELAKHIEWQQQMEKQMADETARKQEKEAIERQNQLQLQEELERQRRQEELAMRRSKPKRTEQSMSPNENDDPERQNTYDDPQQDGIYRSASPPVPTIKNKGKKPKANPRRVSQDDINDQSLPLHSNDNDDPNQLPFDDNDVPNQQTYRKPITPKEPATPVDVLPSRKKPPSSYRPRPAGNGNPGIPIRTNSMISLRSDGSDSEVLNRLEHLKRQLKDKEARLHQHAKSEAALLSDIEEHTSVKYRPPSGVSRRQSPGYLLDTSRTHRRDLSTTTANDRLLRVLQTDDDDEFKPSYFRDDSILMRGGAGITGGEYISPSKRVDLSDGIFVTNIEDTARRRRYGLDPPGFFDRDDPTSMANLELSRIAQQNEHRLKKLRDLEKDDTSLLDSNEVLERFQQKQRLQRSGSQTTLQDNAWLK